MADKNQLHNQNNGQQPKRRSSGRRKIKGSDSSSATGQKKNKTPQRGMGVEKLERMRLQERWNVPLLPDPVLKMDGYGAPAYLGFQYGQVDLFEFGNNNNNNNYSGLHYCNACHKKKRFNGGDDCGVLGLNSVGDYQNVIKQENDQSFNFGTKMVQGHVEIVAVHKKGSTTTTSSSSRGLMMEYEFFPSSSTKSDSQININDQDDEMLMMNLPETPSSTPRRAGSSCVDLSLKLSY